MKSFAALLGSLLLLSMLGVAAYAQNAGTGAIAGVVSDPSGAVINDATIRVTSNQTGETRTAVSSSRGNYSVSLLLPGVYTVEASKAGFKNTSYKTITVSVTEILTLNIQMQVGSVQETIEVNSAGEQLQTETSSLGRVTDRIVVESMPLVTRNYTQIIGLSAGVSADVTNAGELGRGNGSNGGDAFVAAGGSNNDNNFQMNGVEINDFQQSGNFSGGVAVPNPDTIQEFKVQTGQYDASYGRDAGANVNVVTKTGTNQFHGTMFEFLRNEALNANEWFRNENGQPRQLLRQNQYGMTFGGPIVKDNLQFFTSYQGTRQTNGVDPTCSTTFNTPPLTDDRSQGALGALFYNDPANPDPYKMTYLQQFFYLNLGIYPVGPTVAQDGSNISAPALKLLQMKLPSGQYLYPTPQRVDPSQPFSNQGSYSVSNPCTFYEEQFMTNADWNQSARSQWQLRFFFANSSQQNTLPATNLGGPTAPGFPYVTKEHFRNVSLTYNHTFSNNLLNQAEIGYHRIFSGDVQSEVFTYPQIGVTIAGPFDNNPAIYVAGLPTVGGNGQNIVLAQNTYVLQDTVAWQKGHHAIRFGGGATRAQDNQVSFQYIGGLLMLTPTDFLLGQAGDTSLPPGLQFGNVYGSVDAPLDAARGWRVLDANAYFQDDYKVSSRLSLNLGFRYERLGDVSDNLGRVSNFNQYTADPNPPAEGSYQGLIVASNYSGSISPPTGVTKGNNKLGIAGKGQNTWDPRFGFAWKFPGSDKTVIRGGYGVFHSHIGGQAFLQTVVNQPWGLIREQLGTDPTVTLDNPFAFPGQPSILPAFTPYSPTSALSPFSFNYNCRPPLIQRFSLNAQTEITKSLMLEIGYIGTRGLHLTQEAFPDQALDATTHSIRGQTDNTLANLFQRVPLQGFSISSWRQINSEGASWYNALEASLTKRFSHGLQFLASYTWAKELSSDYGASIGANGGVSIGNQYDPRGRYGADPEVRPQRLIVSYVYELPFFKNSAALLHTTLGGWKIAGVTTIQSGHPLPVENTNALNVFGINGPDDDFAQLGPNCTVSQVSTSGPIQRKMKNFINQSCFTAPYPVIGADGVGTAFGNTRPGIFRGPGQNNTDLNLIKNFSLHWPNDAAGIEFRAEMFNAFNHPQFLDPGIEVDGASFGAITNTAVAPRIVQFALKISF
jgi:hypothetical protein